MKKLSALTSIFVCALILMSSKAYSLDITAGVTTWYAWLNQSYTKNIYKDKGYDNTQNHPSLLYGPALSVKFNNDFNLTFIFLYGKFKIDELGTISGYEDINYSFKRTDGDLALSYRLNDYFKIFAGIKVMSFATDKRINHNPQGGVCEVYHNSWGPGLGLSCTYPILENLFFVSNLSGFYLWSKEKKIYQGSTYLTEAKTNCNDYGMNINLSLAYYIAPASTTISLGGRIQAVMTIYNSEYNQHRNDQSDSYDINMFYGITFMATYSFSI